MASKKSLAQAMRDAGANGLEEYFGGRRLKNLGLCPTCGGAGLHKLGCRDFQQLESLPRELARAYGRGTLGRQAWTGYTDALAGVVL